MSFPRAAPFRCDRRAYGWSGDRPSPMPAGRLTSRCSAQTIDANLRATVARFPDREALVDVAAGRRYTYAELDAAVEELARGLLALRHRQGRPRRHLGAELRRVVPGPVRHGPDRRDPRQHQSGLPHARARVRAAPGRRRHPGLGACAFKTSDYRAMIEEVAPKLDALQRRRLHRRPSPGTRCWPTGDAACPARRWPSARPTLAFDDPINIQYTSGTTGFPKGATLSHHNILNNGYFVGEGMSYTEQDRICVPVPFYHCFGMVMGNLAVDLARRLRRHPGARLRPGGDAAGGRGREVHVALRRADDVHRRARRCPTSPTTTCRRCAPGAWPARRARSR